MISSSRRNGNAAPDDGAGGEHLLRLVAEALEAPADDEPDALGHVELVDVDVGAELAVSSKSFPSSTR